MEVACSLDDVARVLADNGYHFSDDSCFAGASELLGALDSPDSFPESPCSDEDIARVLDITRMPSPSLLDSCAHDPFTSHLSSPSNSNESSYSSGIRKTRDPCITNAVLQSSILNVVPGFPSRDSQSLDIFSLAFNNCSFPDDTPTFNTFVHSKGTADFLTNHSNNTYFNSSLALSPVSDTDTILPTSTADAFTEQRPQPPPINNTSFDIRLEENNLHHHHHHTVSFDLPLTCESICVDHSNDVAVPIIEPLVALSPPTKRKRRRKSGHVSTNSKRKKQDNSNTSPKPKADNKPNRKDTNTQKVQPNAASESAARRKSTNGDKKSPKTARVSKKNAGSSLGQQQQPVDSSNTTNKNTDPCDSDIAKKDIENEPSIGTAIGSTNGVTTEEPKGLRRSSRSTRNTENYNFRLSSLVKRVETERKQQEPRQPKGKAKPPPLSKYRRRTANARERDRMKEINEAYENLKNTLPEMEPEDSSKQKITKFTILKCALNYISSLQELLGYDSLPPNSNTNISYVEDDQHVSAAEGNHQDSDPAVSEVCCEKGNHSASEGDQIPKGDNRSAQYSTNPSCAESCGDDILADGESPKQQSVVL